MWDGHVIGFGGGFMWLFWVLLIVGIVWALKAGAGGGSNAQGKQLSAMDILKQRYARGEIDREEYEQKRRDLSN